MGGWVSLRYGPAVGGAEETRRRRYRVSLAAVLDSGSASEDAVSESTDMLLTALGGGYEPETRFVIVKELLDHVDMDLRSLLMRHLEDIRDEARDFDKQELADRAEQLLQRLELAQK